MDVKDELVRVVFLMGFLVIEFFLDICVFKYCCKFCMSVFLILVFKDNFEFGVLLVLGIDWFVINEGFCESWFFIKFCKVFNFVVLLVICKDLINEFLWDNCFCR